MSANDAALRYAAPARILDLRGRRCPATTDETLKALKQLQAGEVLEVVSDYYPARSTIPYHCEKRGHMYFMTEPDTARSWRVRIKTRGVI